MCRIGLIIVLLISVLFQHSVAIGSTDESKTPVLESARATHDASSIDWPSISTTQSGLWWVCRVEPSPATGTVSLGGGYADLSTRRAKILPTSGMMRRLSSKPEN